LSELQQMIANKRAVCKIIADLLDRCRILSCGHLSLVAATRRPY